MKILGFEGTAKIASVAVIEDDKILSSYTVDNGLTQSELLLPMAESVLSDLVLELDDIDLLATAVGPGSFTGVRIGVSLVKGLAFGRNIPCVAVSTLEELAENLRGIPAIIVPVMDARRAQVYNAIFECDGKDITRITEDRAISLSALAEELLKYRGKDIYLVGDGYKIAYEYLKASGVEICDTPPTLIYENAASVCFVAKKKYEAGLSTTDLEISPIYLRMPQAERERIEKEKLKGDIQ